MFSVPVRPAVSSSDDFSCDTAQMPSELASAEVGKAPGSQELSVQWSQIPERTYLSPEAHLFIPWCVEHGCDGAVRATSEQGQSSDGQCSLVSKYLPSGTQLQSYEHIITLSRETSGGELVSVQHPLSYEGFQLGLQGCPDKELVRFVLCAIKNGAALGTTTSLPSRDPFRSRNGRLS